MKYIWFVYLLKKLYYRDNGDNAGFNVKNCIKKGYSRENCTGAYVLQELKSLISRNTKIIIL